MLGPQVFGPQVFGPQVFGGNLDLALAGVLSGTEGADSAALTGNVFVLGTLAGIDGADLAALSGVTVVVAGTLSGVDGADTGAFAGRVTRISAAAAAKIARLDRSIARTGETATLQRTSTDAATGAVTVILQVNVPAHVRASKPQDLVDSDAREMRVILSPTYLLGAMIGSPPVAFGIPERDDKLLIQGDPSNIQEVAPIYYGGALVRVNLLCRG